MVYVATIMVGCGAWGRPCQSDWKFCVLVDTSPINLMLGTIFCCCKMGALELRLEKEGALELGLPR